MNMGLAASAALLLLLVGFAVVGASFEIFSHDVSYYLYVSREVLADARPYRDYIDPNLPTIIYLGVPVAWLTEKLGVSVWAGFQVFVVALEAVSIALCARLLGRWLLPDDRNLQLAVLAVLVTALCLAPMGLIFIDSSHFGQREHLGVLFITPYVLWHAVRLGGHAPGKWLTLGLVAFATVGLAIKPHFLLLWAVLEGWSWLRERSAWPREALIPPVVFGLYFLLLLATLPEFPTWIETTWQLYGAYKDRTPLEVVLLPPSLLALAVLALQRFLPVSPPLRPLRSALVVATAAWWLIGFMQLRGFLYHFAPAASLSLVLGLVSVIGSETGRRALPLVYALLAFIGFASVESASRDRESQDVDLARIFRERAAGGSVLVLSTNVWPGFPAALYADVRWASRFPALWLLPGLYEDVAPADPFPYRKPSQMGAIEKWQLDAVIEDFARQPPALVMVDRYPIQHGFGKTNLDYLAYLSLDARFRKLWCGYQQTDRWLDVMVIYERDPERAARCAGS